MEPIPVCVWCLRGCLTVTVARVCFECQVCDVALLFFVFCVSVRWLVG